MTNTHWQQSAFPLTKPQLLKFDSIVKLQLVKIMHSVHNDKFQICILVFPGSKIFIIVTLEFLPSQTKSKLLPEPKMANEPFPSGT